MTSAVPKLIYSIDCSAPPLELAAQSLTVVRVQDYAQQKGLTFEETERQLDQRHFMLSVPLDELNAILDELLVVNLLNPIQRIMGKPAAHLVLHERFATLTWIDEEDERTD